jgi:hypothetical protein
MRPKAVLARPTRTPAGNRSSMPPRLRSICRRRCSMLSPACRSRPSRRSSTT